MSRTRLTSIRLSPKHALVPVLAAAAIGGTVAISQPASAATANWDAIAQKESGGNWSINTGNGYGGGLQISPTTSAALGGPSTAAGIAALPKSAQIALANKILAAQGSHAWPNTYVSGSSSSGSSSSGSSTSGTSSSSGTSSRSTYAGSSAGTSGSSATTHHASSYVATPSRHRSTATTLPRHTSTATRTVRASTGSAFFTTAQAGVYQTQVAVWQARMDALGYHVQVDGHFGAASAAAAYRFQGARGLQVDGIVGPQTWGATFG